MNYFAHGLRFTERPYFLAGTAVPDWLSVVDRRVRMRARRVAPFVGDAQGGSVESEEAVVQSEVAAGVLQHLDDDRWFHETRAFHEVTGELTRRFRSALGPEDGFRPGFLGHVAAEMLLDAVLIERHPERLKAYYAALDRVDPARVEQSVNRMARHETAELAPFIPLFRAAEFLRDYRTDAGLCYRLNQVLRRIGLKPLPAEIEELFRAGRVLVADRCDELLPAERFGVLADRQ